MPRDYDQREGEEQEQEDDNVPKGAVDRVRREDDCESIASSKKSGKQISIRNETGVAQAVTSEPTSSSSSNTPRKKKKKVENKQDQPTGYDEISIGSAKVIQIASESEEAVDRVPELHQRGPSDTSSNSKKDKGASSDQTDEEQEDAHVSQKPKKGRKKKGANSGNQDAAADVSRSRAASSTAAPTQQQAIPQTSSRSRATSASATQGKKSVQISSHSLQLNSDGTSAIAETKVEVPVVIQSEVKVKPGASKRLSNFDLFAPVESIPVIVLDTLSDAPENDLPPPGFEKNRNVRRTSQQLPQVPLISVQSSELVLKPNLIMTPLDTAHRLQIVERNSHHHRANSGASASRLIEDGDSPIRAHSVADSKKIKKQAKRQSASTRPKRFNNCISTCWWIFATFLVFLISCLAMQLGRIGKLVYPFDSTGNQCGIDNYVSMPSLYYFNVTSVRAYKRCVTKCPKTIVPVCKYNVSFAWTDYSLRKSQLASGLCIWSKATYASAFYRCVSLDVANTNYLSAQQVAATEALTDDLQSQSVMTSFFNILINCIAVLASCCLASVLASAIWYFLLLAIGPILLIGSVAVILISLWGGAGWMGYQYYKVVKLGYGTAAITVFDSSLLYNPTIILGGLLFLGLLAVIFTIMIISARNSMRLASRIMTEAANHLMHIYLVPLLMTAQSIFAIVLSGFAILVVGLLYTVSPNNSLGSGFESLTKSLIQPSLIAVYMTIFIFWYVWTLLINYAFGRAAIAKAIGKVYWSGTGVAKGKTWIGKNALDILSHHFGTIAYGVLAIPVVFFLNIIEYSIRPSFEKAKNIVEEEIATRDNFIDKLKAWVKHVLSDINHRAFIQIALGGGDLCAASRVASDVFQAELSGVMKMGRAISWICVLSIASGISILALVLTNTTTTASSLSSALPIIIVILVCALYVAAIFIQSFAIAIDTILYCYCEDLEMNDGSPMMPYAMPDTLKRFIADLKLGGGQEA